MLERLDAGALATCKVAIAAMATIVVAQVFLRYLFRSPVSWAEEATIFLMVWVSFIGAGYGMSRQAHAATDIIVRRLPPRLRRAIELACGALILSFLALVIYYGTLTAIAQHNQVSPALRVPMSYPYAIIPISAAYMAVACVKAMVSANTEHQTVTGD